MVVLQASAAWAQRLFLLAAAFVLSGCASFYVDANTKEVPAAQMRRVEPLHPVQVLFEFQTKGVANARATEYVKTRAIEQVKASGLFSAVSDQPTPGGALLGITINNVPLSDDAFSKGFVTGLTFGLAGSQVSDGYVCTLNYTPPAGSAPIVKQARHAIHTTMGATSAPGNGIKAASIEEALTVMVRQILSTALNDLTQDAQFK